MEPALKQRLVGAAVLVALAVIFLPMLVQGPAPDSGAADVPLEMPDAPAGEFQTRELPLVVPPAAPDAGAAGTGGDVAQPNAGDAAETAEAAIIEEAPPVAEPAEPAVEPSPDAAELATEPAAPPEPADAGAGADGMFPAATAGGDYAVSFGSYSTTAAADKVVAMLRQSQLPGFRESARVDGKTWYRVRIGPYASRAQAEAARLRAAHVRDDVGARVVVLDAAEGGDEAPAASPAEPPTRPATTAPAAADTGFAVQLAAFSKPADAIALRDRARAAGFSAFTEVVQTDDGPLTRVRVGPVVTREQAEQLRAQVRARLGTDGVVRSHP